MLQRKKTMTDSAQPFAAKKFLEIKGRKMAYIDEGEGAPIVFAHGNPTSSYLWRNVMPACRGLGRLIACDMIGMGDSERGRFPDCCSAFGIVCFIFGIAGRSLLRILVGCAARG